MKIKNALVKIDYFVLALFSIVLALGTWNPFNPYAYEEDDPSYSFAQIIIATFVLYLVITSSFRGYRIRISKANKYLIFFGIILSVVTILFLSFGDSYSSMMTLLKFGIEIVMVICLANLFQHYPHYIDYSLLFYVLVCSVISVLFFMGLLDQFILMKSGRMTIFGENPNSTSGRFVAAAIALLYLLEQNPLNLNKLRKLMSVLYIPLLAMIVSSGSRGSIIILSICVIAFIFFNGYKHTNKTMLILGTGLVLSLFYVFYFQRVSGELSVIERFAEMAEGEDAGRAKLNGYTMEIFFDRPITGYGLSGYRTEMYKRFHEIHVSHNLYYYLFGVSGLMGAIPFFSFLFLNLKDTLAIRKRQVLPFVLMIFNMLLVAKTGGVLTYAFTWYIFAIISAEISLYGKKN